jgi:heme/copper-type cytochrome/quinol oxidase subunit 3
MAVNAHPPEHHTSTGLNHRKLLMWTFLGSECLFFGSLIATHMINRNQAELLHGLSPSCVLDIPITSVSTFVLLMSSVAMVLAVNAAERANMKQMRIWILSTAVLGTIFLLFQVYEFQAFVNEGLTIGTNLFGSTFFTLTG